MRYIETIQVLEGIKKHLEYHQQRIVGVIGHQLPLEEIQVPEENRTDRHKLRVVYSAEKGIEEIGFTPYHLQDIVQLRCVEVGDFTYHQKREERCRLSELHAACAPGEEALLLKNGWVTDTTYCNILFQKGKRLFTPSTPLLAGTHRARLLQEGIIEEAPIRASDIPSFDGAFLINALIDLYELPIAIRRIGRKRIMVSSHQ